MNHFDAGLMQRGQPLLRVVACGFHRLDAALNDGLDVAWIVGRAHGRQKRQVHAKGFVRHGAAAGNLGGQRLWGALGQARDDAQAAGVGHGSGQFGKAHVMHSPLDDGVLDAEHFCDQGFHGGPPFGLFSEKS